MDQVFKRFDADGDGKLAKGEIPEFAGKFILPADADKDGFVTKDELKQHRASRSEPKPTRD